MLNKRKGTACRDYAEKIVKGYLLCIHGTVLQCIIKSRGTPGKNVHSLVIMINRLLKQVGKKIGYSPLTTYCARYTWATIAASLDIPKETIAAALGHSNTTVTDTYITFDHSKIDKANRAVIDYVLNRNE